jgi:hypothetical protein
VGRIHQPGPIHKVYPARSGRPLCAFAKWASVPVRPTDQPLLPLRRPAYQEEEKSPISRRQHAAVRHESRQYRAPSHHPLATVACHLRTCPRAIPSSASLSCPVVRVDTAQTAAFGQASWSTATREREPSPLCRVKRWQRQAPFNILLSRERL